MTEKVEFELVSPERLLVAKAVDMVVVPGTEGDFGVLRGHAPLISTLRLGVIDIHDAGAVAERIFVAGGFAEVTAERCTVLAEQAVRVGDLDRATVEGELKSLRDRLAVAGDDAERMALASGIAVAEAKLACL
jgi:F-type H+-transporting ATPase subunit epsilon